MTVNIIKYYFRKIGRIKKITKEKKYNKNHHALNLSYKFLD